MLEKYVVYWLSNTWSAVKLIQTALTQCCLLTVTVYDETGTQRCKVPVGTVTVTSRRQIKAGSCQTRLVPYSLVV